MEQNENLLDKFKRETLEVFKPLEQVKIVDEAIMRALRNSDPFKVFIGGNDNDKNSR